MKHILLLSFLLTLMVDGYTQESDNTVRAAKKRIIGKTLKQNRKYSTSKATYLGILCDKNSKVKYYVVKEFSTLQAANVPHGHSEIIFFNQHAKVMAKVQVNMPYELPVKISKNALVFTYRKNKMVKQFLFRIDNKPDMLCVEPESCYEIDYK